MSDEKPIDGYYMRQAQELVDWLYDNELLNPNLTRDVQRRIEDYVGFLLSSNADMAVRAASLLDKAKKTKVTTHD